MSPSSRLSTCLRCLWILGMLLACGDRTHADDFRRMFIPQEHLTEFVRGLRPVSLPEFEALTADQHQQHPPTFDAAIYEAKLEKDLLRGHGTLQVRPSLQPGDFLPLDSNVALTSAHWHTSDQTLQATLGQSAEGSFVLAQPSLTTLKLDWSRRQVDSRNRDSLESTPQRFQVRLPYAFSQELRLTLPSHMTVRVNDAVVHRMEQSTAGEGIWSIRWSGRQALQIEVDAAPQAFSARIHSDYEIKPQGIMVSTAITLRGGADRNVLALKSDPNLRIVNARWGDTLLEFRVTQTNTYNLLVELPDRANGQRDFTITISGLMQPPLEQLQPLPRIVPQCEWTGETSTVQIARPLFLVELQLDQGNCTSLVAQPEDGTEVYQFRFLSASGSVLVRLASVSNDFFCESLSRVVMNENSLEATVELWIRPRRDELMELQFTLATNWEIVEDSVEVIANAEDLPEAAKFDLARLESGAFQISWDTAATRTHPVLLRMRVTKSEMLRVQTVSVAQLSPVRVLGTTHQPAWVYVQDRPRLRLSTHGEQFVRWQVAEPDTQIPGWIQESLDLYDGSTPRDDLFLRKTPDAALATIERTAVEAFPELTSVTKVTFRDDRWQYSLDVRVDPQGSEIDNLIVDFSCPTQSAGWSLRGRAETPQVDVVLNDAVEHHVVRFSPMSEPFELHFELERKETRRTIPIPVATFQNANGGQGILGLLVDDAIDLEISQITGVESVPFSVIEESLELQRKYRAVYRYDDSSSLPTALMVRRTRRSPEVAAWVWHADIRSFYSDSGRPQHRADFLLQSEGATELRLHFPDRFTLQAVELDGDLFEVDLAKRDPDISSGSELVIPLPADQRYPCVSVKFSESERPLRVIDWLTPPVLEPSLPVMQQTWQHWLPRDYRVYRSDPLGSLNASWLERLVGLFGSAQTTDVERSFAGWFRRRWISKLESTSALVQRTQMLLGPDFSNDFSQSHGWGARLNAIEQSIRGSQPSFQLLVDRPELRRLGISPVTPMPASPPGATNFTPLEYGVHRLSQSGLALVVDGPQMVLTSSAAVKLHASKSDWIDQVSLDGRLAWFGTSRLTDIATWNAHTFENLWRHSPHEWESGIQQAGWWPVHHDITDKRMPVKIYHGDTVRALCCLVVCFGLAFGWRLVERRKRLLILLGGTAFALALLLPQPGAALACTFAWTLVASYILQLSTRTRRKRQKALPAVQRRALARTAAGLVLLSLAWSMMVNRTAAQVVRESASERAKESLVYVPIDNDRKPLGTVYLSEAFYRELRHRHDTATPQSEYLLTGAHYLGAIEPQTNSMQWTIKYDIVTLVEDVLWPLPDFGEGNQILLDRVRIDPTFVRVPPNGQRQHLSLRRRGDHRITIVVSSTWTRSLADQRLHLPIPQCPNAKLELKVPRTLTSIHVPSARGQVVTNNGILSADLGPTPLLDIIARTAQPDLATETWPAVTRVIELFVSRDDIFMDVDFEFPEDEPVPLLLTTEGSKRIEQPLKEPWDSARHGKMRFRLPPTTGRFVIPHVTPTNARLESTRVTVSSDGHQEIRLDDSAVLTTIVPEDTKSPQAVDFRFEVSGELPSLEISNVPTVENWNSELSYFFDHTVTHVDVKAQLVPTYADPRMITVRRLRVPSSLAVHELTVSSSEGIPQRLRWHRNGDEIAIFFLEQLMASASAPVEISLRGELTTRTSNLIALPIAELVSEFGEAAKSRHVAKLYRAADIDLSVELESIGPFLQETSDVSTTQRPGYRIHGAWGSETVGFQSADDALIVRRVSIDRNIHGTLTTRLEQDGDWFAKIDAALQCDQGIDVVYLDVPASLCEFPPTAFGDHSETQPLRCEIIRGGPKQGRAILAVWLPDDPERVEQVVRVSTKLNSEQTSLPQVRLLNVELSHTEGLTQNFVELPRRGKEIEEEVAYVWKPSGLTPVAADDDRYFRFRVSQREYEAVLEEQQSGLQPEVLLLDTRCSWQQHGSIVAVSEFYLKPGRETRLLLQLPRDAELVQVYTDGHPTAFENAPPIGPSPCYSFALASSPWPQRIEAFWQGPHEQAGSQIRLNAPRLRWPHEKEKRSIPIRDVLWDVEAPAGAGLPTVAAGQATPLQIPKIDQVKIKAFTELWLRAQTSIRERPRQERIGCLTSWARHLQGPVSRRPPTDKDDPVWQALENITSQYAEAFALHADAKVFSTDDLWEESRWSETPQLSFHSLSLESEDLPSLELTYAEASGKDTWLRYGFSALFLCLGVVLCRWEGTNRFADFLGEHPHPVLLIVGALWRLCLSPPWIGTGIMILIGALWVVRQLRYWRGRPNTTLTAP